jgi:hypothetical protein
MRRGDLRRRVAHPEADFQDPGRRPPERPIQIDGLACIGDAVRRQQIGMGAGLGRGEPPLAQHVAAYRLVCHEIRWCIGAVRQFSWMGALRLHRIEAPPQNR